MVLLVIRDTWKALKWSLLRKVKKRLVLIRGEQCFVSTFFMWLSQGIDWIIWAKGRLEGLTDLNIKRQLGDCYWEERDSNLRCRLVIGFDLYSLFSKISFFFQLACMKLETRSRPKSHYQKNYWKSASATKSTSDHQVKLGPDRHFTLARHSLNIHSIFISLVGGHYFKTNIKASLQRFHL